jgi:hypothetical protein
MAGDAPVAGAPVAGARSRLVSEVAGCWRLPNAPEKVVAIMRWITDVRYTRDPSGSFAAVLTPLPAAIYHHRDALLRTSGSVLSS